MCIKDLLEERTTLLYDARKKGLLPKAMEIYSTEFEKALKSKEYKGEEIMLYANNKLKEYISYNEGFM